MYPEMREERMQNFRNESVEPKPKPLKPIFIKNGDYQAWKDERWVQLQKQAEAKKKVFDAAAKASPNALAAAFI